MLHAVIVVIEVSSPDLARPHTRGLFGRRRKRPRKPKRPTPPEARANAERLETDKHAKQDRDAARRELASGFEHKIGRYRRGGRGSRQSDIHGLSTSISDNNRATTAQTARRRHRIVPRLGQCGNRRIGHRRVTASIGEIAKQVSRSAEIAGKAAEEARRTNSVVEGT